MVQADLTPACTPRSPALVPGVRAGTPSTVKTPTSRSASPAQPFAAPPPPAAADAWDLDVLAAAVPSRSSPLSVVQPETPVDDLFDMGFDGSRFAPAAAAASVVSSSTPAVPSGDDFDLLDAFAAPAVPSLGSVAGENSRDGASDRSSSTKYPEKGQVPTPRRQASTGRAESPPPHIVGQLVEMGFPPAAATAALGATRSSATGGDWSVDAALEILVEQQQVQEAQRHKRREADEWGDEDDIRIGRRRSWEHDDDDNMSRPTERPANLASPRTRPETGERNIPTRTVPARSTSGTEPSRGSSTGLDGESAKEQARILQEQANEVLAQAQKIGLSMFKSANAYWGEGKKALQKALDEQRAAARTGAAGASSGAPNGKPKWWREGMDEVAEGTSSGQPTKGKGRAEGPSSSGFKDSDDDEDGPEPATRTRLSRHEQQPAPTPRETLASAPPASEYRSPFRRAKPNPAPAPGPTPAEADLLSGASLPAPSASPRASTQPAPSSSSSSRPNPAQSPSPASPRPPAPRRQHVAVSPSALASASKHKTVGNEHFKLGRFGDATASFTLALNALPEDWIGCVPLLNNRAQARLRSGEEKAAAADCSAALAILSAPTKGEIDLASLDAESGVLPTEVNQLFSGGGGGGASIDLKDQLGKSLSRRAKANEANEKWALASEDWQKLLTLGDDAVTRGAGGIKMISDGVARCRQMVDGPGPSRATSASANAKAGAGPSASAPTNGGASRPARPRKPATPVQGAGEAVRALQAQQAASAAEDDLRLQLKDQVDAQIAAWKGGKETNLRALIASLDAVLWPSLGWKTVGMHELISESQLKVRYVRAIAKVHPDKVSRNRFTLLRSGPPANSHVMIAQRAKYDTRAAHDRRTGLCSSERRVERYEELEDLAMYSHIDSASPDDKKRTYATTVARRGKRVSPMLRCER
jgi:tetratricopeptide (TPR) repeat protein